MVGSRLNDIMLEVISRNKRRAAGLELIKPWDISISFSEPVSYSQTQPKVAAHLGPQYLKSVLKDQNFQNGTPESITLSLQKESGSLH